MAITKTLLKSLLCIQLSFSKNSSESYFKMKKLYLYMNTYSSLQLRSTDLMEFIKNKKIKKNSLQLPVKIECLTCILNQTASVFSLSTLISTYPLHMHSIICNSSNNCLEHKSFKDLKRQWVLYQPYTTAISATNTKGKNLHSAIPQVVLKVHALQSMAMMFRTLSF